MNVNSFFSPHDVQGMRELADTKAEFDIKKSHKAKRNRFDVTLGGHSVSEECARDIWRGHNYLLHVQIDYHGEMGIGGFGYATEVLTMLASWDDFIEWFNKLMKRYPEYEIEEEYQMCLF